MIRIFVITTIMASFATGHVFADDEPGKLNVTGSATVTAEPDEGYISVGVNTKAETAREALVENTSKMETLFKTLNEFGVQKKDFRTTQFSLQQAYKTVNKQTVPDGFVVHNQLRVTVCELDTFGKVLDALIMGGANRVDSISFGSSEAKAKTNEARSLAVKDALAKAEQLLEPLGQVIVKVASVSTSSRHPVMREMYSKSFAAAADTGNVPISGGSLSFTSQVNIQFDIRPKKPDNNHIRYPAGSDPRPVER